MNNIERNLQQLSLNQQELVPFFSTMLGSIANENIESFSQNRTYKNYMTIKEPDSITRIKQLLSSGRLMCTLVLESLEQLTGAKYTQFDALVAENQCELRGLQITYIAMQYLSNELLRNKFLEYREIFIKLKEQINKDLSQLNKIDKNTQINKLTIKEAFKQHMKGAWEITIPKDLIVLTLSYTLTKTKKTKIMGSNCALCTAMSISGIKEETDIGALEKIQSNTLPKLAKRLTLIAKQTLSTLGCEFLQNIAQKPSALDKNIRYLSMEVDLQEEVVINKTVVVSAKQMTYSRALLPCFFLCTTAYQAAVDLEIPILLKSKVSKHSVELLEDPFDYAMIYYKGQKLALRLIDQESPLWKTPVYVIEGQRASCVQEECLHEYSNRLEQFSLQEIIAMDAIHHRQYVDSTGTFLDDLKNLDFEEKQRLHLLYKKAETVGVCNNQKLFMVTHVFCDSIENQFSNTFKKK